MSPHHLESIFPFFSLKKSPTALYIRERIYCIKRNILKTWNDVFDGSKNNSNNINNQIKGVERTSDFLSKDIKKTLQQILFILLGLTDGTPTILLDGTMAETECSLLWWNILQVRIGVCHRLSGGGEHVDVGVVLLTWSFLAPDFTVYLTRFRCGLHV